MARGHQGASRREFVKWHAKQGLVLSLTWAILYPLMKFLHKGLDGIVGPLAEVFWAMAWLVVLGVLIAALVCIVRGLEGERFKVPLLGDLADRL